MKKIAIIEDDATLREEVRVLLERNGYEAFVITDFANAAAQVIAAVPDLVLLDIVLPETNGQIVLRDIRARSNVPVIMLTSRDTEIDEIVSRSSGADDYITKPYNPTLLLLRIEGIFRRMSGQAAEEVLTYRGMALNILRSSVTVGSEEMILSKNETRILYCLIKKQGKIVSRDELMDELWNLSEFVDDNTLTVNMNRLRRRLASVGLGDVIETRRGQGYILV